MRSIYSAIVIICYVLLSFLSASAQNSVRDYIYSFTFETFEPLTNDTILGSGFQDDWLYMGPGNSISTISGSLSGIGFPIGFPFVYDGVTFTRFGVSSNGFIKLSTGGTFTMSNSLASAFTSTSDSVNQRYIIAGLHGDIMSVVGQGKYSYRTIGSPGSRILVVEFRNVKHYVPNPTSEEFYNFQIRLHEGSNKVSFIYGQHLKDATTRNYTVGLRGFGFNNIHLRTMPVTSPSWTQNNKGLTVAAQMPMNLNITPPDGLVFNFFPREYDNDLELNAITAPEQEVKSCELSSQEAITVVVKNVGILPQSSATIGYVVGNNAPITQSVTFNPVLAPQASQTFTINTTANLSGLNPPRLKAFVHIPNEEPESRNNDTLAVSFTIGRPFETFPLSRFDSLTIRGWKRGRGANAPSGTFSLWGAANAPAAIPATMLLMRTDTPSVKNEWIYSPGYRVDTLFNYSISFKAAMFAGATGIGALSTMGDDTIKLVYSTDCYQTWKTLRAFRNADLTGGAITNSLTEYVVNLPSNVRQLVTFAFLGKNNGNNDPNADYRFVFRDFRLNRVPRFDLSADTVRVPSVVSLSCKYSTQEPVWLRITNRGFEPVDSVRAGFSLNNGLPIIKTFNFNPPLQPNASTTLIFDGNFGADFSIPDGITIRGFVMSALEDASTRQNDTARRSYNLISPLTTPTPVYETYASLLGARWQRGRGTSVPFGTSSSWGNRNVFPGNQTAGVDFPATQGLLQEWLYSAAYEGPSIVKFSFKAAVTAVGATTPATSLNQDTLKVLYSIDCGASWVAARKFSNQDLQAGLINNQLREYTFELPNPRNAILVGFAAFRSAGAPAVDAFTFHVDSVVINSPAFTDLAAQQIIFGTAGPATCPSSNRVAVRAIVRNSGNSVIPSATVGYLNNGVATTRNVTFPSSGLAVGARDTINFSGDDGALFPSPGNYSLRAFVFAPGEAATTRFNDTSSVLAYNILPKLSVPHIETFAGLGLLPVGWISDTLSGRGFRISAGRGPGGLQALSFRAQPNATTGEVITRNFGPILASTNSVRLNYRTLEASGAFFRLRPTDYIDVLVSTNCGLTYTPVGRIDSLNQQIAAGFLDRFFDISAYTGQDISIKIVARLTPKPFSSNFLDIGLFAIDINTSHDQLVVAPELRLFPNPFNKNSGCTIVSDKMLSAVFAISTDGKTIALPIRTTDVGKWHLDTNKLKAGLYTLLIKNEDKELPLQMVRVAITD